MDTQCLMHERWVSEIVKDSLKRYVEDGCPTGHFLEAVLSNNLTEAIGRADDENLATLPAIVSYCYNKIPADCWGSPEKVDAWLKRKIEERKAKGGDGG